MLRLTPTQKARLRARELKSFLRACRRQGYDPDERREMLLEFTKADLRRFLDSVRATDEPAAREFEESMRSIFEADDYFTASELLFEDQRKALIEDLVITAPRLPINFAYLKELARQIGLREPTPEDPSSLEQFLLSIPTIILFDLEFNAFVNRDTLIDSIPCVSIYDPLLITLDAFSDLILPAIISFHPDGTVDPATPEQVTAYASNPDFQDACSSCLEVIFGQTDRPLTPTYDLLMSHKSTQWHRHQALVLTGAHYFVNYHEYGHLLMGHLAIPPSWRVEYEADYFANTMIARGPQTKPGQEWKAIGAILTIVLLAIIEAKYPVTSNTQPPASLRLKMFIDCWGEPLRTVYRDYARAIALACNETLMTRWGVAVYL